ncbi:hypothetical protein GCM10009122_01780 [Fulvivirga kasyanovii]|uniref:Uncharacterized protein n=1 Tax=Fulvivirga kasyanovii TaxID=396812 RepID=A0ABW9RYE7_9BACT|nr:hypothetical protein [Fulvivirga kasyanovii]MTI28233.1 hypothetical protein [Fulvivirga kasyanovii]
MINQVYKHTAHLLASEKKSASEVIDILTGKGIPQDSARQIVEQVAEHVEKAKKNGQKKICYMVHYGVLVV